jgi:hypothetical protein
MVLSQHGKKKFQKPCDGKSPITEKDAGERKREREERKRIGRKEGRQEGRKAAGPDGGRKEGNLL